MRKISAFVFMTLNGYYKGIDDDTSWHLHGEEGTSYSEKQLNAGDILLFGRKTYEMMAGFWPTKMAAEFYPVVAEGMNNAEKIVLSNSLQEVKWLHTQLMSGDTIKRIKELKKTPGKNITILGSGEIISQFADAGLIDEYLFLIDPIAIGKGTSLFEKLKNKLELTLKDSQIFKKSGSVLLTYVAKTATPL